MYQMWYVLSSFNVTLDHLLITSGLSGPAVIGEAKRRDNRKIILAWERVVWQYVLYLFSSRLREGKRRMSRITQHFETKGPAHAPSAD